MAYSVKRSQSEDGKNRELHDAIMKDNFDKVIELCLNDKTEDEADINWKDNDGCTALHKAVKSLPGVDKEFRIIEFLLRQKSTKINEPDKSGWTPLHSAFKSGYGNLVALLIKYEADINILNSDGKKFNEVSTHKQLTYS